MKLKSCHVNGFGALKNKRIEFSDGITEFLQTNGIGKTTLAAFLKAMLYGMENCRSNGKEFKDREHFFPFDRGSYGGTLTVEHGGNIYRIERSFDEKSAKADKLTVYKDGSETYEFNDKSIGEVLLGVNRESFEKTLFITADDVNASVNDDIKTRLGNTIQGTDDDSSYENADKILEDAVKTYNSRSKDALIPKTKDKITELKSNIKNTEEIQNVLDAKYNNAAKLNKQINELENRIKAEQTKATRKAERKAYDEMINKLEKQKEKKKKLEDNYPNGIPTEDDIENIKTLEKKKADIVSKRSVEDFSEEEKRRFTELTDKFSVGLPTETALEDTQNSITELRDKRKEADQLQDYTPTEEEERIIGIFSRKHPTDKELADAQSNYDDYEELNKKYESEPTTLHTATEKAVTFSPTPFVVGAAVGGILAVIGAVLLALKSTLPGAILTPFGAVILLVSGFLYLNKKSSLVPVSVVTAENPESAKTKSEMEKKGNLLKAFLLPYGYGIEKGFAYALKTFTDDLTAYDTLISKTQERKNRINELTEEGNKLNVTLSNLFNTYGYVGTEYDKLLDRLKGDVQAFTALTKRDTRRLDALKNADKSIAETDAALEEYKKKYALRELNTDRLALDNNEYQRLTNEIDNDTQNAENYSAEHGISDVIETETESLDTDRLNDDVGKLREERAALQKQIEYDEADAEKLDGYRAELEETEEKLAEYEKKLELLSAARELLKEASDTLNKKYVEPVLNEFRINADTLGDAIGRPMTVNRDFELFFEDGGMSRSEKYLSAGQRTLCLLCFRIALIKNIYKDTAPFLILDDPFVTLDETNMARARYILERLSQDTPILYLTCHPSRRITDGSN